MIGFSVTYSTRSRISAAHRIIFVDIGEPPRFRSRPNAHPNKLISRGIQRPPVIHIERRVRRVVEGVELVHRSYRQHIIRTISTPLSKTLTGNSQLLDTLKHIYRIRLLHARDRERLKRSTAERQRCLAQQSLRQPCHKRNQRVGHLKRVASRISTADRLGHESPGR